MIPKTVSDVKFGKLTAKYGRAIHYEWEIGDGVILHYPNTRQLTSQRKFRDKFLELTGIALLRVSSEAWNMIINRAYSTVKIKHLAELEEIWLRQVAQYVIHNRTEDQRLIAEGKVYETNTGLVFTSSGIVDYMNRQKEMKIFLPEWHTEKLRQLLNVKSSSMSLKNFKGRAMKLNNYSGRVDPRFYEYCAEAA